MSLKMRNLVFQRARIRAFRAKMASLKENVATLHPAVAVGDASESEEEETATRVFLQ